MSAAPRTVARRWLGAALPALLMFPNVPEYSRLRA